MMVNFRTKPPPRSYLSRPEQRRLLMLVFALGVVVVAMFEARKAENWQWFTGMDDPPARLANERAVDLQETPATNDDAKPGEPSGTGRPGGERSPFFPGVEPEYLKKVQDNQVFRPSGNQAWLNLLEVAATNDDQTLAAASVGPVEYVQLAQQPQQYRGQLVDLSGTALRCISVRAVPNNLGADGEGIDAYYQVMLRATNGPARAISLYCLELPDGFPTGDDLREPIRATAFFFKNRAFTDGEGVYITPTLIARSFDWRGGDSDETADIGRQSMSTFSVLMMIVAASVIAVVVVFIVRRGGGRSLRGKTGGDVPLASLLLGATLTMVAGTATGQSVIVEPTVDAPDALQRSFSIDLLDEFGVETDRWTDVKQRSRLSSQDRELFYQLLNAAGTISNDQLRRQAKQNLRERADQWKQEEEQVASELRRLTEVLPEAQDAEKLKDQVRAAKQRRFTLQQMLSAAAMGQFSVIPFFNRPQDYRGELVTLRGTALRALEIPITNPLDPKANRDIVERFGIDHYYEIEIVTDDSQNNPLALCIRELPPGFPVGERIGEPVEVTGFFFKSWVYPSKRSRVQSADNGSASKPGRRLQQVAPIFIGRQPLWIESPRVATSPWMGIVACGLFMLVLAIVSLVLWRARHAERRFHQDVVDRYRHPTGGSAESDVPAAVDETAESAGKL